jgi:hypothetical protein
VKLPIHWKIGLLAGAAIGALSGFPLLVRSLEATATETPLLLEPAELDAWTAYHAACEVAWSRRIGGETEEIVAACADRMLAQRRARSAR